MQEIELKFLVPSYKTTAIKRQTHIKSSQTQKLSAYYFDVPNETLAKQGIAIRIRQEDDNWVQTLKTAGDGIASRLEFNHDLDKEATDQAYQNHSLQPDLSLYKKTPLKKQLKALINANTFINTKNNTDANETTNLTSSDSSANNSLLNNAPADSTSASNETQTVTTDVTEAVCDANESNSKYQQPLLRLYSTEVERTSRLIKSEDNCIEVAFDTGCIIHGSDDNLTQPIQEIEFELLAGDKAFLFNTAKVWCKRYQLSLSTITKAEAGKLLLEGRCYPQAVKTNLNVLNITPNISRADFIRAVIHNCLLQILPNASAISAGSQDGEHVHQLRVGIRRLRTVLKFFADFSEQTRPEWLVGLKQTFNQLGEYRERDILKHKTQPMLESIGAPKVSWSLEVTTMPIDAVRANHFQLILLELIEFVMTEEADDKGSNVHKLAKTKVSKRLDKLFNDIITASNQFDSLEIEEKHSVRKQLKALRYLSEFASPLYQDMQPKEMQQESKEKKQGKATDKVKNKKKGKKGKQNKKKAMLTQAKPISNKKLSKQFTKYIRPAQKQLGDYNDNFVAHAFYAEKAKTEPNAYFAVGWLSACEQQALDKCTQTLLEVQKAPKFW